jgi:hypothetical protein
VELDAPTLKALFHHYDMDGNGVLAYDEVLALCASMKQGDAEVRPFAALVTVLSAFNILTCSPQRFSRAYARAILGGCGPRGEPQMPRLACGSIYRPQPPSHVHSHNGMSGLRS